MFTGDMQHGAARHQHLEVGTRFQHFYQKRSCCCYLLKVVQQEKQLAVSQIRFQLLQRQLTRSFPKTECLGNSRNDMIGIADWSQRDKEDTFGKVILQVSRYLQTQASLSNATDTCEVQQAYLQTSQEGTYRCYLLLAPNYGCY